MTLTQKIAFGFTVFMLVAGIAIAVFGAFRLELLFMASGVSIAAIGAVMLWKGKPPVDRPKA